MITTDYIVEPATPADVEQLIALEQELFMTDNCSRKNFKYLISHVTVIVARTEKTGEIAGYAILLNRKNSTKEKNSFLWCSRIAQKQRPWLKIN